MITLEYQTLLRISLKEAGLAVAFIIYSYHSLSCKRDSTYLHARLRCLELNRCALTSEVNLEKTMFHRAVIKCQNQLTQCPIRGGIKVTGPQRIATLSRRAMPNIRSKDDIALDLGNAQREMSCGKESLTARSLL